MDTKLTVLVRLAVAPWLGLAFVVALPCLGFWVVGEALAKKVAAWARKSLDNPALKV